MHDLTFWHAVRSIFSFEALILLIIRIVLGEGMETNLLLVSMLKVVLHAPFHYFFSFVWRHDCVSVFHEFDQEL